MYVYASSRRITAYETPNIRLVSGQQTQHVWVTAQQCAASVAVAIDRENHRSLNRLKMVEEDHAAQMAVRKEQHFYCCSMGSVGDTVPLEERGLLG